jgi:hypothetical protein
MKDLRGFWVSRVHPEVVLAVVGFIVMWIVALL